MFSKDKLWVWIAAGLSVLALGWAIANDSERDYVYYQAQFKDLVRQKLGPEKAAQIPSGIQQIWVQPAGRVDRCVSCHQGVTWEGLDDAPEPFRSHPKDVLKNHPVDKFGCTLCHGGQGMATSVEDAHGWVKHWEDPVLDSQLAQDYKVDDPNAFIQIKCNSCHRYDKETTGADFINNGKRIMQEKGCRACHTVNGRGGQIGPDLTYIGDKQPEQYNYERLTDFASVFNWEVGHLKDPKAFTPDTVMPNFGLSTRDAQSIAMLLQSWKDEKLPMELLPEGPRKDVATPEEAAQEKEMMEGPGKFFVQKTCFICHDVSSLNIHSATKIGPDLALAYEDAPRRFGRSLDDFLHNPSGTMSVVLSRQIHLTPDEVNEAIRLLKIANEKYHAQKKAVDATAAKPAPTAGSTPAKPAPGSSSSH